MTVTTNVPKPTFGSRGFVPPSEQAIFAGVMADMVAAFGGGLNPAVNTPQGQLASSTAAMVGNFDDIFVKYVNLVDPAFSSGRMQDGIARIYFLERNAAQPTVVQAQCVGGQGVLIPQGALARAADGNAYTCTTGGEIPASGTVTLPFACNVFGPIACPADSLNSIYRAIPGWDSINNADDGVLGNLEEGPRAFEARRRASVALNARGSLPAVRAEVLSIAGVLDVYVTENAAAAPVTKGGVVLAPKSLYVAVVGGDLDAVARAIWSKKAPGCDYTGNTTRTVLDDNSGYSAPLPSYAVTFEVPDALAILFAVNISDNPQVPSNAAALIQTAIILAFAGADGGARASIGATVFASRFYAAVSALGAWAQVISIEIGSNNGPAAAFTADIAGTTLTVSVVTGGALAIGQTISDPAGDVITGTKIISGSGLSWQVSNSQTVTSRAMTSAVPGLNSVTPRIDQVPTVSANNIAVVLT